MIDPALVHLVLRHDHVLGRRGQTICSSVTQIDLHDFSRLATTYGLGGFHCITPLPSQLQICSEILDYWHKGAGKNYNPDRNRALTALGIHADFETALEQIGAGNDQKPVLWGTSAQQCEPAKTLDFSQASHIMDGSGAPLVIQFGTSWGLSPQQLSRCDGILAPIEGRNGYNHLSVRCAAAIIVDRLFARNGAST